MRGVLDHAFGIMDCSMNYRFILLLMLGTRAWGCSCGGTWASVKQAWKQAPFVFLGTVESANPDGDPRQMEFQEQSVRIRVDEGFKGSVAGQTFEQHEGASDCDAKFRTGQRAVFYLFGKTLESSHVAACTHSLGSADPGGDDLLFLRGLPKSAKGTRLSGEVELYEESGSDAFHRVRGLADIPVKISGPKGSRVEARTNADGVYEQYNLPPGKYSVSITVPKGLRVKFPVVTGSPPDSRNEAGVELPVDGGVSVGFVLEADTKVTGRLLDAKGNPINGVCLDLEPVKGRGDNGARFFDCSKDSGKFKMEMMPPGQYWLVARDERKGDGFKSKSTFYYPSTRDRNHATIISIEAGKYSESLDMQIPASERRHRVTGRMQFADGAPVPHATVTFTSDQRGYTETTETVEDGSFGFLVVAGIEGSLKGQVGIFPQIWQSCPEFKVRPSARGMIRIMDAVPVQLLNAADHEDVRLILPFGSCKVWPPARE
jgi:hypothetical protein